MSDPAARDMPQPQRIERTLRVVQRCRRALLRFTDETELLRAVCDAVVTDGGYTCAWVGVADPEPGTAAYSTRQGDTVAHVLSVLVAHDVVLSVWHPVQAFGMV